MCVGFISRGTNLVPDSITESSLTTLLSTKPRLSCTDGRLHISVCQNPQTEIYPSISNIKKLKECPIFLGVESKPGDINFVLHKNTRKGLT